MKKIFIDKFKSNFIVVIVGVVVLGFAATSFVFINLLNKNIVLGSKRQKTEKVAGFNVCLRKYLKDVLHDLVVSFSSENLSKNVDLSEEERKEMVKKPNLETISRFSRDLHKILKDRLSSEQKEKLKQFFLSVYRRKELVDLTNELHKKLEKVEAIYDGGVHYSKSRHCKLQEVEKLKKCFDDSVLSLTKLKNLISENSVDFYKPYCGFAFEDLDYGKETEFFDYLKKVVDSGEDLEHGIIDVFGKNLKFAVDSVFKFKQFVASIPESVYTLRKTIKDFFIQSFKAFFEDSGGFLKSSDGYLNSAFDGEPLKSIFTLVLTEEKDCDVCSVKLWVYDFDFCKLSGSLQAINKNNANNCLMRLVNLKTNEEVFSSNLVFDDSKPTGLSEYNIPSKTYVGGNTISKNSLIDKDSYTIQIVDSVSKEVVFEHNFVLELRDVYDFHRQASRANVNEKEVLNVMYGGDLDKFFDDLELECKNKN